MYKSADCQSVTDIQDENFWPFRQPDWNYKSLATRKKVTKAGFGYDNSVSLQTDDAGNVGAAVFAHVACVVGLQTNNVRCNRKGLKISVDRVGIFLHCFFCSRDEINPRYNQCKLKNASFV